MPRAASRRTGGDALGSRRGGFGCADFRPGAPRDNVSHRGPSQGSSVNDDPKLNPFFEASGSSLKQPGVL